MIDRFEIKYRKIPIEVSIKGIEKLGYFTFIVDTGASHSIIDKNFIKTIGYTANDYTKTENLSGFGGNIVKTSFVKIKSLSSLGLIRRNFEIGVMEFSSKAFYEGILGIDFFLNHKLSIDFKKGIIELA